MHCCCPQKTHLPPQQIPCSQWGWVMGEPQTRAVRTQRDGWTLWDSCAKKSFCGVGVCACVYTRVCAQSLSHVQLFVTPWTVARQALLSMGFSRQQYWSGLPRPSPGDLPHPVVRPASLALAGGFFTTEPLRKSLQNWNPQQMEDVSILYSGEAHQEVTWGQIKGTRKAHQEIGHLRPWSLSATQPLNHCKKKLPTKSSQVGHSFLGHRPAVAPFAWQSNKAILFYFTQNSVSEIGFGTSFTEAEFLASAWGVRCAQHRALLAESPSHWIPQPLPLPGKSWQVRDETQPSVLGMF